jgi:putative ABC transport system permease protein
MPNWNDLIRRRLRGLRLSPTREREIVDELAQHLQDRYEELRAGGATDEIAFRDAIAELEVPGFLARRLTETEQPMNPEPAVAGAHGSSFAATLWQDLRYAARVLRKNPTFTLVSTLTLALGIGATTAIFSVVYAVMLKPLPYRDADRLVRIWESDVPRGRPEFSVSTPNFVDFRARAQTFERMAASNGATLTLATPDGVEPLVGRRVSLDFLPVLGVAPALGRNFLPEEDRPGGNTRVAIVTHGFWQRRLGANPSVLGTSISLSGASHTIVGVMPQSFDWVPNLDILVPMAPNPAANRGDHQLVVIGKMKAGISLAQANADLQAIAAQLSAQYPESNGGWSVLLRSFYDWLVPVESRRMLLVFLSAVGFVLLIAAGNVANLLLARAVARQKEMSIRVALGAGRRRVLSQLLVESILLAFIGGAAGCALAYGITTALKAMATDDVVPRLAEVGIDTQVLLFATLVSVLTGLLFGLAPAVQASKPNMNDALKDAGRTGTGGAGRQRLRDALVVAEVALSAALLVGAGLLVRSMWTLQNVNPGFDARNLLTIRLSLSGPQDQTGEKARAFYRETLDKIRALPGVTGAATSSIVPLSGGNTSIQVVIEGRPADAKGIVPSADWRVVSARYFDTLGVSLRGRDFDERDVTGADDTAPRPVIISEEMARRYWPGVDPIGRQFFWYSATGPRMTIVGVAGDVRNLALETDPAPVIYLPSTNFRWNPTFLMIRTAADPTGPVAAVRGIVRAADPSVAFSNVRTAEEILATSVGPRRFNMFLLGSFAAVALVLACVGLFGVMSYLVSQRTHDIGVRLALGAVPADIFRLVVGRGMALAGGGALLGLAAAFWLSRSLEALLFQVRPTDLLTFATVVTVLLVVALIACAVPARRATRVDPVIALRYE